MDTEQFISRLVPPGNFFVVAYKGDKGMRHKYFRDAPATAGYIKWAAGKGMDTWHACSSFAKETQKTNQSGGTWLDVERKQDNVAEIKAFWVDLDIARPGDGKDPAKVYADPAAATTWLKTFCKAIAIPLPNVIVNSGYGLHIYWMVETAMSPATWQPYAEALKAAILAHNGLADIVVTADSARILRTPGTFNFKVPATPMPVKALLAQPDYPNAVIYAALQPFVGVVAHTTVGSTGLGPAPAHVGASALNAAAQTNVAPRVMDKSFAAIATKCEQIRHSLATNGAQDSRPIWYLGNLSTAHHTIDGADFVHPISSGHKDYDPAAIDKAVAAIVNEKRNKDSGPPTCRFYDQQRPGICQSCAFFGKVTQPWHLGAKDGDLPKGYRRHNGRIEKERHTKDAIFWDHVVDGDVYGPVLSVVNGVYQISFTYEMAGRKLPIAITALDSSLDVGFNIRLFNAQQMTLDTNNAVHFGAFAMAFLNQMKKQRLEREDTAGPYGWASTETNGVEEITGLAITGMLYKADGTKEQVPGADRTMATMYKPRGVIAPWKKAANFLIRGRPDAALMIAASMGSPLMKFAAQPGVVLNFYSRGTATGKSSACQIAQNVWATMNAMSTMGDTELSVCAKTAMGKVVPVIWDEIRVHDQNARAKTDFMFSIAQGREKTRLRQNATLSVGGEWQAIMICTGNQPLMDYITSQNVGTDANGMRLMDFEIEQDPLPADADVALMVRNADFASGSPGAALAAYYAENAVQLAGEVLKWQKVIAKDMLAKAGERFYIAALACSIVAAKVAKKLDLVAIDEKAMWTYIKKNWMQMRGEKSNDITKNGKVDISEVFGRFYSDHQPRLVQTNFFKNRGPVKDVLTVVSAPLLLSQPVVMHAAQREKVLRIDLTVFKSWLNKKNIPVANTIKEMKAQWGATDHQRQVLGIGTLFSAGQKATLEVDLVHPDLIPYDPGDDPTDPAHKKPKVTVKAAPVPGNQVI